LTFTCIILQEGRSVTAGLILNLYSFELWLITRRGHSDAGRRCGSVHTERTQHTQLTSMDEQSLHPLLVTMSLHFPAIHMGLNWIGQQTAHTAHTTHTAHSVHITQAGTHSAHPAHPAHLAHSCGSALALHRAQHSTGHKAQHRTCAQHTGGKHVCVCAHVCTSVRCAPVVCCAHGAWAQHHTSHPTPTPLISEQVNPNNAYEANSNKEKRMGADVVPLRALA
jgi:hypothetical protein